MAQAESSRKKDEVEIGGSKVKNIYITQSKTLQSATHALNDMGMYMGQAISSAFKHKGVAGMGLVLL